MNVRYIYFSGIFDKRGFRWHKKLEITYLYFCIIFIQSQSRIDCWILDNFNHLVFPNHNHCINLGKFSDAKNQGRFNRTHKPTCGHHLLQLLSIGGFKNNFCPNSEGVFVISFKFYFYIIILQKLAAIVEINC